MVVLKLDACEPIDLRQVNIYPYQPRAEAVLGLARLKAGLPAEPGALVDLGDDFNDLRPAGSIAVLVLSPSEPGSDSAADGSDDREQEIRQAQGYNVVPVSPDISSSQTT